MVGRVRPVAVGFDFDHTLGVDNKLERIAFVQLMQRMAGEEERGLDIARASEAIDQQIALYRAGKCSLSQAFDRACEAVTESMNRSAAFDAFRELAVSLVPQYVKALPGVGELLEQLDASGLPYAILTNGWNPLQQCKADAIGFSQPVFVSDDIGVRKPSVKAFNVLRDLFALEPEQIWYVGDDPLVDIVGALGAGMRAVWCDWEERKYPTNIPAPTAIVKKIQEVLDLIM